MAPRLPGHTRLGGYVTSEATPVRRPRRHLVLASALIAVLAAQSIALVVQQNQISDLQHQSSVPGQTGPSGPPGPAGPPGPIGLTGPAGADGKDAVGLTVIPTEDNNGQVPLSETEARAHCTIVAGQTYPGDSNTGDTTADSLTDAYSATMHERAFQQCLEEQGYAQ